MVRRIPLTEANATGDPVVAADRVLATTSIADGNSPAPARPR